MEFEHIKVIIQTNIIMTNIQEVELTCNLVKKNVSQSHHIQRYIYKMSNKRKRRIVSEAGATRKEGRQYVTLIVIILSCDTKNIY